MRGVLLPLLSMLISCGATPAPAPAPARTLAELHAVCFPEGLERIDWSACYELGRREASAGRYAEAVPALNRACGDLRPACIDLGLIYLQGRPGVPVDQEKGFDYMGKACTGNRAYDGCGWYLLEVLAMPDLTPAQQRVIEGSTDYACRYATSGWPCTNYGVALSCGLFGAPDDRYALSALGRGCRLGDGRACSLIEQVREPGHVPVSCALIGPPPEHPVELDLHLEPLPPDAVLPDGKEPFKRTPLP